MLLTVSTTHQPATDLGFLLHKHPDRVQKFEQSFGTATVFYPQANETRCTAALLLDVDPVKLARNQAKNKNSPDFSLGQYVNDRSYAASSLLGVALAKVFSTARSGRCDSRPELAATAIPLEIEIPVLPCRGGSDFAHRLFEPLGWVVTADPIPLDETFPDWGDSHYVRLQLTGVARLADALNQLHILLPVLDESKHYWQGADEVDKLLHSGESWLAQHPDANLIARRYLGRRSPLTRSALSRLAELAELETADSALDEAIAADSDEVSALEPQDRQIAGDAAPSTDNPPDEKRTPLNVQRHESVQQALLQLGARSVIDLGCGSGQFLSVLVRTAAFTRIVGTDVSVRSLQYAARRLHLDRLSERQAERIELFQSSLTYVDERLSGFDAAVLMEVIEHVDLTRLTALEWVVFGGAKPGAVLVTTPNSEYNVHYAGLINADGPARMRHPDHRFEWTRAEFEHWCRRITTDHGYDVEIRGIGEFDDELGTPTQFAIFTREAGDND